MVFSNGAAGQRRVPFSVRADCRLPMRRCVGRGIKRLPVRVQKRYYGKQVPKKGRLPKGICYDVEGPLQVAACPARLQRFVQWVRSPSSDAQRNRRRDRYALHRARLQAAATVGKQLLGLLAFYWLREDIAARGAVAAMLCRESGADWANVHRELASAKRRRRSGAQCVRRGRGAWPPADVRGLTSAQSEVATLRAWCSCVTTLANGSLDGVDLGAAPGRGTRSVDMARYLATLPGVGRYLAVKVLHGMELIGSLSFGHGIVGPGALAALCYIWAADDLQCGAFRLGLWPWEHVRGEGQMQQRARQMRAAVCQAAFLSAETWLFTQVALCTWKMNGFPVAHLAENGGGLLVAPAAARASAGDVCDGQLCRSTLRAALCITDMSPLGVEGLSRKRRLDFVADAVAAAAAGASSVRQALLSACAVDSAVGHVVACRAATWPSSGHDVAGHALQ